MGPQAVLKSLPIEEQLEASWFVLMMGRLTGWNFPVGGGGDPVYLTGEQAAVLAAEGVRLLATFLPAAAAEQVTAAVAPMKREKKGSREERLMRLGNLGAVIPTVGVPGDAPGCCVESGGHLICIR